MLESASAFRYGPAAWDRSVDPGRAGNHARTYQSLSKTQMEVNRYQATMRGHASRGDALNIDACLLDRPSYVDVPVDFDGGTPLHIAARRGHYAATQNLVHRGACLNRGDKMQQTALHAVAEGNHGIVCSELIRAGADAERRDLMGQTPLHRAAFAGSIDAFVALADSGVDTRARDEGGLMAVHKASTMGRSEVLELLLERDPGAANIAAESGWTPLHLAAFGGHAAACEVLLLAGADVRIVDDEGQTPLHRAAYSGSDVVCQLLLRARADPLARNRSRAMPLHIACEEGFVLIAQTLLEHNAQPDAYDGNKRCALSIAAEAGDLGMCEELLRYGADPFATDPKRGVLSSPFVLARLTGHYAVVELFQSAAGGVVGGSMALADS